ncbi:MAG: acetyl-CoA carboxylase biotin carboxylase subunit [Anaerolineales bacterium]|nr:acetyl-CoA carboxylase biotin carboxylase subunit [Anaerolineales bacterium]
MAQFNKILIANRGEIAVRLIRACRESGVQTVAVYSEADRASYHVRLADEAIAIGPAPALESYLCADRIIDAARSSKAQAIHPGYGFLSENAAFAHQVQAAGLVFIGPPAAAIAAMGDKAEARNRMIAAGIPVVPGRQNLEDEQALTQAAAEIGYPVMIKAAAGGGGKGMRIVMQPGGLLEAAAAARREALHAFGDDRLILEAYIPQARHIEFQILADQHGNMVHLFERECSVQRRHQKIIEETPSPLLTAELRTEMGAAAIKAAQSVGYTNAGTVEFICDPNWRTTGRRPYYFLEMNTRLQVEHPVTELVAGLDLVHWQIRIAAGERLPFQQSDLTQRGHAIECRIYAEDPEHNFLPSSGKIHRLVEPEGPGVRFDSGYTSGDSVLIHYDPLIAKLIVQAADRPAAIQRMAAALEETVILGLTTNLQFLVQLIQEPDFLSGEVHTAWVEERFDGWQAPHCRPPEAALAAAALLQARRKPQFRPGQVQGKADPYSPWESSGHFRIGMAVSEAVRHDP